MMDSEEYGTDYEDMGAVARVHMHSRRSSLAAALLPPSIAKTLTLADELRSSLAANQDTREPTERDALLEDAVLVENAFSKPSLPLTSVITHRLSVYFTKCRAKGFLDLAGPAGYTTVRPSAAAIGAR
jgi:hypothetical protein